MDEEDEQRRSPTPEEREASLARDYRDAEQVYMPAQELTGQLRRALVAALPVGAGLAFNLDGDQAWVCVSKPGDTTAVLQSARQALGEN